MTDSEFRSDNADFDAVYRGDGPYAATPAPWDIGGPQPSLIPLEAAGLITGTVLDSGCGTGENALFLADKGYDVTGVDLAPTAIRLAQEKAKQRGLDAAFEVADVFALDAYSDRFDTVIDSAVAHLFHGDQLAAYAASLHRVCRAGGVAHVLALSDRSAAEFQRRFAEMAALRADSGITAQVDARAVVPSLTADELCAGFAEGWVTEAVAETEFRVRLPVSPEPIDVPGQLARFRRV